MKKRIKIGNMIILIGALIIIGIASAEAQVRKSTSVEYHQNLQKEMSWENYQDNYKKNMLAQAKATGKAKKETEKREKKGQRFVARLERIKK